MLVVSSDAPILLRIALLLLNSRMRPTKSTHPNPVLIARDAISTSLFRQVQAVSAREAGGCLIILIFSSSYARF